MRADLGLYWALRAGAHSFPPQSFRNQVKIPAAGWVSTPWFKTFLQASLMCFLCWTSHAWNSSELELAFPFVFPFCGNSMGHRYSFAFTSMLHNPTTQPVPGSQGAADQPSSLPFSSERKIRHCIWNDERKAVSEEALRIFLNKVSGLQCTYCAKLYAL